MLSRRDEFAKAAMQKLIPEDMNKVRCDSLGSMTPERIAHRAMVYADALIAKLAEGQPALVERNMAIPCEIARLRAELAKYTGDLTNEQAHQVMFIVVNELGGSTCRRDANAFDAAIRRVRSWEGEG